MIVAACLVLAVALVVVSRAFVEARREREAALTEVEDLRRYNRFLHDELHSVRRPRRGLVFGDAPDLRRSLSGDARVIDLASRRRG